MEKKVERKISKNKVIAEFLGYNTERFWWFDPKDNLPMLNEDRCKWDSDWNELIPLTNTCMLYVRALDSVELEEIDNELTSCLLHCDISGLYDACFKLAVWHNKQHNLTS